MKPRHVLFVEVGLALLAFLLTQAEASNIGYRYKLGLTSDGPTEGLYWISIPYSYTPPDINANLLVDPVACEDDTTQCGEGVRVTVDPK